MKEEKGVSVSIEDKSTFDSSSTSLSSNNGYRVDPEENNSSDVRRSYTTSQKMGSLNAFCFIINTTIGTGIFSIPSSIFAITGSVAITLALWIIGALLVASGLCVIVEYAMAIPRSGGEKNYLERVCRRPRYLVTCILASLFIVLGGPASSCIAFGSYVLQAAGHPDPKGSWDARIVAVVVITSVILLHTFLPRWGVRAFRFLGFFKLAIMMLIICAGFAALAGHRLVDDPHNFDNMFTIEEGDGFGGAGIQGYSSAIIRVLFTFGGSNTIATILGELRTPRKTLPIVLPLAIGIVTVLYLLVNVAYFAAISKTDLAHSDVIVAGVFFRNMFGDSAAARMLPALVAVSNLGSIITITFAHGRMNQELAKEGILPWSHFWAADKPFGAPGPALFLNWLAAVVVILAPPAGPVYTFIIDMVVYPHLLISTLYTAGLLWLRFRASENWSSPYRAPLWILIVSMTWHAFIVIMPWYPTEDGKNSLGYPYFVFPLAGLGVFIMGGLYWFGWAKVLPKLRGYRIQATRKVGPDGREVVEYRKVARHTH